MINKVLICLHYPQNYLGIYIDVAACMNEINTVVTQKGGKVGGAGCFCVFFFNMGLVFLFKNIKEIKTPVSLG